MPLVLFLLAVLAFMIFVGIMSQLVMMALAWVEANREASQIPEDEPFPFRITSAGITAFLWDVYALTFILVTTPIGWVFPRITERYRQRDGRPLLVLIHGFSVTSSAFITTWLELRRRGYKNVVAINLLSPTHTLEEMAEDLHRQLERLTGGQPQSVMLCGKSMGGLVIRAYLHAYREAPLLAGAMTLGSPHRGSYASLIGYGVCARQMAPTSTFIAKINSQHNRTYPCRTVGLYSTFETWVIPQSSAIWPNADKNISVDWIGHNSMQFREEVIDRIVQEYDAISLPAKTASRPSSTP